MQEQQQKEGKQHPPMHYLLCQIYSIRKESLNGANDQVYKKLGRKFQQIKKMRQEGVSLAEYDYESTKVKKDFKRLHQLYNSQSKAHLIAKRKIDKVKNRVDKIKNQLENDEQKIIQNVDIYKLYGKSIQAQKPK